MLLVVMGAILGPLDTLTRSENRTQALVQNEQNVRFIMDRIARDIRASNPLVAFTTKSTYANQIEMLLGPAGGTQQVVRWIYDTNALTLTRQVMSDTTPGATVVSTGATIIRVRNAQQSPAVPVFAYYGQHEEDLVAASRFTAADVANCALRVRITILSDSNPGPQPFTENLDVELRNLLPGGVGCG
jgi:hypothetical protein